MARALGVKVITASSTLSVIPRVDAGREEIRDAPSACTITRRSRQTNSRRRTTFAAATKGMREPDRDQPRHRPLHRGQLRRAGLSREAPRSDRVAAHQGSEARSGRLTSPSAKAMHRSSPVLQPSCAIGSGHIPAQIEYEYRGADTVAEVKRCADYCRAATEQGLGALDMSDSFMQVCRSLLKSALIAAFGHRAQVPGARAAAPLVPMTTVNVENTLTTDEHAQGLGAVLRWQDDQRMAWLSSRRSCRMAGR